MEVRAHPQPSEGEGERSGITITAGAAVETTRFSLHECTGDCAGFRPDQFPTRRLLGGGYLRLGNDWRYVGLHAGGLVMPQFLERPGSFSWDLPIPDVYLRFGRLDGFYVDIGHHRPITVFHPGFHLGLNYVPAPNWLISLHGTIGLRLSDDNVGARTDLELRTPITDSVIVGLGGSVSDGDRHAEYEVRSLVGLRF